MFSRLNIGFFCNSLSLWDFVVGKCNSCFYNSSLKACTNLSFYTFFAISPRTNVDQDVLCSGSNLSLYSFFMSWS